MEGKGEAGKAGGQNGQFPKPQPNTFLFNRPDTASDIINKMDIEILLLNNGDLGVPARIGLGGEAARC